MKILKKVLVLTNTIAPYRIPVLNKFNNNKDIDLEVWYLEEREKNRQWKFDYSEIQYKFECLKGVHGYIQKMDMGIHFNPGLLWKMIKLNPSIVVTSGYDAIGYWTALLYCKLFRKKYVVWWGSTLKSSRVQNKWINNLRKLFFKNVDSFVTYGSDATECLIHYKVDESKIVTGYNTVDIGYFYKKVKSVKPKLNKENVQLLFIGQLIPRKGLNNIIECLEKIDNKDWELTVVGSGPDEEYLKQKLASSSINDKVIFTGYKQKEEVLDLLIKSDCLLFPSIIEVWGLVVNEAISTNTFVLSSIYAGATRDLIIDEVNGLKFDPLNEHDIVKSLNWVIENKEHVRKYKRLPLGLWRRIHPYTYAKALELAIKKVLH